MRSLLWSYFGSRRFPREMSTFEVRRFFTLSSDDRHVLRRRFRSRSRLGAALQLIGELTVEREFLEGALGKFPGLSGKR